MKIEDIIDHLKSYGFEYKIGEFPTLAMGESAEFKIRDYDIEYRFKLLDFEFTIWACESIYSKGELYYNPESDHYFSNIRGFDTKVFREDQLNIMLEDIINSLHDIFRNKKDIIRHFNITKLGI